MDYIFIIHLIIIYNNIPRCRYSSNLYLFSLVIDGYFFAMFNGLIIPIFLATFAFLIHRNVQQNQRRTVPKRNININRSIAVVVTTQSLSLNLYNFHLIIILLIQLIVTIFLNIP